MSLSSSLWIDSARVPPAFRDLLSQFLGAEFIQELFCQCPGRDRFDAFRDSATCLPHAFASGTQDPRYIIMSCADARFPDSAVFGAGVNALFSIRFAGGALERYNPQSRIWHSLNLALSHYTNARSGSFKNLQGICLLGHAGCGFSARLVHLVEADGGNSAHMSPIEREVAYGISGDDRHLANRAIQRYRRYEFGEEGYLASVFRETQGGFANAITVAGLVRSKVRLERHLRNMGIDLPVCLMMVGVDIRNRETPLVLMVQQPDKTWQNVVMGPQLDILSKMRECPSSGHTAGHHEAPIRLVAAGPAH